MATKDGQNFTSFQNVRLKGSGVSSGGVRSPGHFLMGSGRSQFSDTTISVQPISGSTVGSENGSVEAQYFHIEDAGLSLGTGHIRIAAGDNSTTVSIGATQDSDYALTLPSMSGTIPVMGTFEVAHAAVGSLNYESTIVNVAGIRVDDAVIITPQLTGVGSVFISARGKLLVGDVVASNGQLEILFVNVFTTTTRASSSIYAYSVIR